MLKKIQEIHQCPDWDFLEISPGDPEFECCHCYISLPAPANGSSSETENAVE